MDLQAITSDPNFQSAPNEVKQRILEKASPEYSSAAPEVKSAILSKIMASSGEGGTPAVFPAIAPGQPMTQPVTPQPQAPVQSPGLLDRLGTAFQQRQQNVNTAYDRHSAAGGYQQLHAPETAVAVAAGQAANFVGGDLPAELITSAWETMAPDTVKKFLTENLTDFAKTKVGQMGISALSKGMGAYKQFSNAYPDAALALESTVGFSLLGLENAAKNSAKNALMDVKTVADKTGDIIPQALGIQTVPLAKRVSNKIRQTVSEVIDLSGEGKSRPKQRMAYLDRAESAIGDIVANKDNLTFVDINGKALPHKLPTNRDTALMDMTQAIEQTKQSIWPEVEIAMQDAANVGKTVSTKSAIANIQQYISSPSIVSRPDSGAIIKQGKKMIEYYQKVGELDPLTAQTIIKDRNTTLQAMKRFTSTSLSDTDKAGLYAAEKSGLNDSFRQVIGNEATGALQRYGNLLEIEDDFNKMIHTRLAKGGVDYAATWGVLEGIKTLAGHAFNPSALGAAHLISEFRKANYDAGKKISKMFKLAEKSTAKQARIAGPMPNVAESAMEATGGAIATGMATAPYQQDFKTRLENFKQQVGAQ
jgi:hypothetical protein